MIRRTALVVAIGMSMACAATGQETSDRPDVTIRLAEGDVTSESSDSTTVLTTGPTTPSTAPVESEPSPSTATATTSTASTPTTSTSTTTVPESGDCVDDLDVAALAGLVVWPAADPADWDSAVAAVTDHGVGGVVLMGVRTWNAIEVTDRLADLEASSRHGLVVATDEEGGDVQRLRVLGLLPAAREVSAGEARAVIAEHGRAVRGVGVDVVFGPVVDVEPVVGRVPLDASRLFPGGPGDVATTAAEYVAGWNDAGLVATLKHFPGHGAATGDTHDVAGITPDLDALRARDLLPYERLGASVAAGDALVMVGHLTVPGLTDGLPATQSKAAIDLLRRIDGYDDALVVTDALGMGAVGLPEPEAAVRAIVAGIDVVIFTRTSATGDVVDAIVDATAEGTIVEAALRESARRVMAVLERDGHACNRPAPG